MEKDTLLCMLLESKLNHATKQSKLHWKEFINAKSPRFEGEFDNKEHHFKWHKRWNSTKLTIESLLRDLDKFADGESSEDKDLIYEYCKQLMIQKNQG